MTLLELLKHLFTSEGLGKTEVQEKLSPKTTTHPIDEEEEIVAMEIADEEEEFFI